MIKNDGSGGCSWYKTQKHADTKSETIETKTS